MEGSCGGTYQPVVMNSSLGNPGYKMRVWVRNPDGTLSMKYVSSSDDAFTAFSKAADSRAARITDSVLAYVAAGAAYLGAAAACGATPSSGGLLAPACAGALAGAAALTAAAVTYAHEAGVAYGTARAVFRDGIP